VALPREVIRFDNTADTSLGILTRMSDRTVRIKPVFWMGSARSDLRAFPPAVQADVGYALFAAQCGDEYRSVKALQGFGGRSVLEIVAPHDGNTFRAVYTVQFKDSLYVLHAFQKKSTKGSSTPKRDIDTIRHRLVEAKRHHEKRQKNHGEKDKA
jgi:phage-related protein